MLNYVLQTDGANDVSYLMIAGGDRVLNRMPRDRAMALCERGMVSKGEDERFPIVVNGKYFFQGTIAEVSEAQEREIVKAPRKKRRKRKA